MGLAERRFELNVTVSYSLYATVSVVLYMKYFFNSNSRSSSKDSTSNKKFTNIPNSIIPFCLYLHKNGTVYLKSQFLRRPRMLKRLEPFLKSIGTLEFVKMTIF